MSIPPWLKKILIGLAIVLLLLILTGRTDDAVNLTVWIGHRLRDLGEGIADFITRVFGS